jgi:hypothetical protein
MLKRQIFPRTKQGLNNLLRPYFSSECVNSKRHYHATYILINCQCATRSP